MVTASHLFTKPPPNPHQPPTQPPANNWQWYAPLAFVSTCVCQAGACGGHNGKEHKGMSSPSTLPPLHPSIPPSLPHVPVTVNSKARAASDWWNNRTERDHVELDWYEATILVIPDLPQLWSCAGSCSLKGKPHSEAHEDMFLFKCVWCLHDSGVWLMLDSEFLLYYENLAAICRDDITSGITLVRFAWEKLLFSLINFPQWHVNEKF